MPTSKPIAELLATVEAGAAGASTATAAGASRRWCPRPSCTRIAAATAAAVAGRVDGSGRRSRLGRRVAAAPSAPRPRRWTPGWPGSTSRSRARRSRPWPRRSPTGRRCGPATRCPSATWTAGCRRRIARSPCARTAAPTASTASCRRRSDRAAVAPGPVALVVGDVSFLHDLNALVAAPPPRPLRDDRARQQRWRRHLLVPPPGDGVDPRRRACPSSTSELFGTPHGIDVAPIVTALGGEHVAGRTRRAARTGRGVDRAAGRPGPGAADGSRPERRAPSGRRGRGRAGDRAMTRIQANGVRYEVRAGGRGPAAPAAPRLHRPRRRLGPVPAARSAPRGPPSSSTCSATAARTGPAIRLAMPSSARPADLAAILGRLGAVARGRRRLLVRRPHRASSSRSTTPRPCTRLAPREPLGGHRGPGGACPSPRRRRRPRRPHRARRHRGLRRQLVGDDRRVRVRATLSAATRARFRAGRLAQPPRRPRQLACEAPARAR